MIKLCRNESFCEEKWGEPLLLLILVTALSGKPLISGRKRPWASGEMKIGNIDSHHLYGERKREGGELHFKRSRLHLGDHLSVFLAFGLVNGFDFLRGSLLLYGCMRKQQGSAEVTQIHQHISKCHTVASRTTISGFRTIRTKLLKAQFTQNTEIRQKKWLFRGDDVFMWFDLDTKEVKGSYKVAPVSAGKHFHLHCVGIKEDCPKTEPRGEETSPGPLISSLQRLRINKNHSTVRWAGIRFFRRY